MLICSALFSRPLHRSTPIHTLMTLSCEFGGLETYASFPCSLLHPPGLNVECLYNVSSYLYENILNVLLHIYISYRKLTLFELWISFNHGKVEIIHDYICIIDEKISPDLMLDEHMTV